MQKPERIINLILTVNRYKSFMENINLIRTFCGCKPSKKTTLSLIKILLVLIKRWMLWINSKIHNIKKHTILSEMSFCNVFQRAGLNYCLNDNFQALTHPYDHVFHSNIIAYCQHNWLGWLAIYTDLFT